MLSFDKKEKYDMFGFMIWHQYSYPNLLHMYVFVHTSYNNIVLGSILLVPIDLAVGTLTQILISL